MTEQTEGAEVEALIEVLSYRCQHTGEPDYSLPTWCRDCAELAHAVLASDWLAARIAAAEQRGREDNAEHATCYPHGSKALEALIAEAEARGAVRVLAAVEAIHPDCTDAEENCDLWDAIRAARAAAGGGS